MHHIDKIEMISMIYVQIKNN